MLPPLTPSAARSIKKNMARATYLETTPELEVWHRAFKHEENRARGMRVSDYHFNQLELNKAMCRVLALLVMAKAHWQERQIQRLVALFRLEKQSRNLGEAINLN